MSRERGKAVAAAEVDKGMLLCRHVFGCDGMESAVAQVGKKESLKVHATARSEVSRLFGRVRVSKLDVIVVGCCGRAEHVSDVREVAEALGFVGKIVAFDVRDVEGAVKADALDVLSVRTLVESVGKRVLLVESPPWASASPFVAAAQLYGWCYALHLRAGWLSSAPTWRLPWWEKLVEEGRADVEVGDVLVDRGVLGTALWFLGAPSKRAFTEAFVAHRVGGKFVKESK